MNLTEYIRSMQPGQELRIAHICALKPSPLSPTGAINLIDEALDNIIGSAYEYGYRLEFKDFVVFRLKEPLKDTTLRTYVSPDRRHLYKQTFQGFYQIK